MCSSDLLMLEREGIEVVAVSDVGAFFTSVSRLTCTGSALATAVKDCVDVGNGGLVLTNAGR